MTRVIDAQGRIKYFGEAGPAGATGPLGFTGPTGPADHEPVTLADAATQAILNFFEQALSFDDQVSGTHLVGPSSGADTQPSFRIPAYVYVWDKKAAGATPGTLTSGAWGTRDMNHEQVDTAGIASVASNQITIAAGTYRCRIATGCRLCNRYQSRLRDVTNSVTLLIGTNAYCPSTEAGTTAHSIIAGHFVLMAQTVLEIQYQCETTIADEGYAITISYGEDQVLATAEFWRDA